MFLKSLSLKNFRNYKTGNIQFSDRLNVFVGENAQGKTNLIEAVLLSSVGKSFRASKDKEMIKFDCQHAHVTTVVENDGGEEKVDIHLFAHKKKSILINDINILKVGELMGTVPTVIFTPKELKIVQSSPQERRAFLDIALSQMSKGYFYTLMRYEKILSQRNKLLKSGKAEERSLSVWDAQLSQEGAKIIHQRRAYIERLKKLVYDAHLFLSDSKEELFLEYLSFEGNTTKEIETNFEKALLDDRDKDLRLGYTNSGPHKDDIKLSIQNYGESEEYGEIVGAALCRPLPVADKSNGRSMPAPTGNNSKNQNNFKSELKNSNISIDLRSFGSQGQQRTAALSLKIAELELFANHKKERPILLLDDVLSELDKTRSKKLLEKVSSFQTLLTTTHLDFEIKGKVFRVEKGLIK
ncbi:MAG: DNA replication/repair protein RecF [Firmicutes bacterium]|nr:DNA replication/repair protein RecF [Bacillota bacterium]